MRLEKLNIHQKKLIISGWLDSQSRIGKILLEIGSKFPEILNFRALIGCSVGVVFTFLILILCYHLKQRQERKKARKVSVSFDP